MITRTIYSQRCQLSKRPFMTWLPESRLLWRLRLLLSSGSVTWPHVWTRRPRLRTWKGKPSSPQKSSETESFLFQVTGLRSNVGRSELFLCTRRSEVFYYPGLLSHIVTHAWYKENLFYLFKWRLQQKCKCELKRFFKLLVTVFY